MLPEQLKIPFLSSISNAISEGISYRLKIFLPVRLHYQWKCDKIEKEGVNENEN
jgi:hypothetical protein